MYTLDFDRSDAFVSSQQDSGNDVYWDGWTLVFFKPHENAIYTNTGEFRNGQWGYANRFDMNSEGKYLIDARNLKRPRRGR